MAVCSSLNIWQKEKKTKAGQTLADIKSTLRWTQVVSENAAGQYGLTVIGLWLAKPHSSRSPLYRVHNEPDQAEES